MTLLNREHNPASPFFRQHLVFFSSSFFIMLVACGLTAKAQPPTACSAVGERRMVRLFDDAFMAHIPAVMKKMGSKTMDSIAVITRGERIGFHDPTGATLVFYHLPQPVGNQHPDIALWNFLDTLRQQFKPGVQQQSGMFMVDQEKWATGKSKNAFYILIKHQTEHADMRYAFISCLPWKETLLVGIARASEEDCIDAFRKAVFETLSVND